MSESPESSVEFADFQLTPKGRFAAMLCSRFGVEIKQAEQAWDLLSEGLTAEAKRQSPDCDAACVVLVGGGEVIPLFKAQEPEIEEVSGE